MRPARLRRSGIPSYSRPGCDGYFLKLHGQRARGLVYDITTGDSGGARWQWQQLRGQVFETVGNSVRR